MIYLRFKKKHIHNFILFKNAFPCKILRCSIQEKKEEKVTVGTYLGYQMCERLTCNKKDAGI